MDGPGVVKGPSKQENARQDGQRRREGIDAPKGRSGRPLLVLGSSGGRTLVGCLHRDSEPFAEFGGGQRWGIERGPDLRQGSSVVGEGGHHQLRSNCAALVVLCFVHWVHRGSMNAGVHHRHSGHIGWLEPCLEVLQPAWTPDETDLCLSTFNGSCSSTDPAPPHGEGRIPRNARGGRRDPLGSATPRRDACPECGYPEFRSKTHLTRTTAPYGRPGGPGRPVSFDAPNACLVSPPNEGGTDDADWDEEDGVGIRLRISARTPAWLCADASWRHPAARPSSLQRPRARRPVPRPFCRPWRSQ